MADKKISQLDPVSTLVKNLDVLAVVSSNGVDLVTYKVTPQEIVQSCNTTDLPSAGDNLYISAAEKALITGSVNVTSSSINGNIRIQNNETVVYTHPAMHSASIIDTDSMRRFLTDTQLVDFSAAYTHSVAPHARVDATNVTASLVNGYIKINDFETLVYSASVPSHQSLLDLQGGTITERYHLSQLQQQNATASIPTYTNINLPITTDAWLSNNSNDLLSFINTSWNYTKNIYTNSELLHGFNPTSVSTIDYNFSNKALVLTGNYSYYYNGLLHTQTSASVVHGSTTGNYYIYFATGSLVVNPVNTLWSFGTAVPVASLYYNASAASGSVWDGPESIVLEERHTTAMPPKIHQELHFMIGAWSKGSGFSLDSITLTNDALTRYGVSQGTLVDEDLESVIEAMSIGTGSAVYPIWYRWGTDEWRWKVNTYPYLYTGTNPYYNQSVGGSYRLTTISSNNTYMNMWLCAMPFIKSSSGNSYKFIWVMGQNTYTSLANAQAVGFNDNAMGSFPTAELLPLQQVTLRYNSTYTNSPARVRNEGYKTIIGTRSNITSTYNPQDHNILTNRSAANSHPATAISYTPSGYITSVDVDSAIDEVVTYTTASSASIATLFSIDKNRNFGVVTLPGIIDLGDGSVVIGDFGVFNFATNALGDSNYYRNTSIISGELLSLTDNAVNYIYCSYNNGSPSYDVTLAPSDYLNDARLNPCYRVIRDGTLLCILDYDQYSVCYSNKNLYKDVSLNSFQRQAGLILSTSPTRSTTVSSGSAWFGVSLINLPTNVANSVGSLYEYYLVSSAWNKSLVTEYDSIYYSDGVDRQSLGSNKYVAKYFFRFVGTTNAVAYIHGNQYTSEANALAEALPNPPTSVAAAAVYIGKIVIKEGTTNGTAYGRDWGSALLGAQVTSHESLAYIYQAAPTVLNGHVSDQTQTIAGDKTFTGSTNILGSGSHSVSGSLNLNNVQVNGNLWSSLWNTFNATYVSTSGSVSTLTMSPAETSFSSQVNGRLFSCFNSDLSIQRIGYVKSAVVVSSSLTMQVVTDTDLTGTDRAFQVTPNIHLTAYKKLIFLPNELLADANNNQGMWEADLKYDSFLLPVDSAVNISASGSGAACAWNIYSDNNQLFALAQDIGANNLTYNERRPTTMSVLAASTLGLRLTNIGGARRPVGFQARLYIVPQHLFSNTVRV